MGFAKNERGVERDEQGNVSSVKLDKHLVPGDEGYGTHVPASVTSEDEYAAGLEGYDADDTDDADNVLVTDADARELLERKGEVADGAHERAVERRQQNEAKANPPPEPAQRQPRREPTPAND